MFRIRFRTWLSRLADKLVGDAPPEPGWLDHLDPGVDTTKPYTGPSRRAVAAAVQRGAAIGATGASTAASPAQSRIVDELMVSLCLDNEARLAAEAAEARAWTSMGEAGVFPGVTR